MEFKAWTFREIDGLDDDLANSIWQLLVYSAPYDTGNLRSAIKKQTSNNKRIKYIYDTKQAVYLQFLEEGLGFVKKYKGFIEYTSVGEAIKEILYWAETGKTTFDGVPTVVLQGRLNKKAGRSFIGGKPMGYEKRMLNDTKTSLTARERGKLSQLNYKMYNGIAKPNQFRGQSVNLESSVFTSKTRKWGV